MEKKVSRNPTNDLLVGQVLRRWDGQTGTLRRIVVARKRVIFVVDWETSGVIWEKRKDIMRCFMVV